MCCDCSLRRGAPVLALGLAAGALALATVLGSRLYGVGRLGPLSLAFATLLLLAAAVVATVLPAARSARIDPMRVLRTD